MSVGQVHIPRVMVIPVDPAAECVGALIGLVGALKARGLVVTCAVTGPQFGLASQLRRMTGRSVSVLDPRIVSEDGLGRALARRARGAEIVVVYGNTRIDRGLGIARTLGIPVLFVVDGAENDESVIAHVKDVADQITGVPIVGAIVTNLPDEALRESTGRGILESIARRYDTCPLIGLLPTPPRSFVGIDDNGSLRANPLELSLQDDQSFTTWFAQHADIDRVLLSGGEADWFQVVDPPEEVKRIGATIAVASDGGFAASIGDTVDIFRELGVDVQTFSPLAERSIPRGVSGVFLGGCFLGEYLDEFSQNRDFFDALKQYAQSGGVVFAEGSGAALFFEALRSGSATWQGVGLIKGQSYVRQRPIRTGELLGVLDSWCFNASDVVGAYLLDEVHCPEGRLVRTVVDGKREALTGFVPAPSTFVIPHLVHMGTNLNIPRNIIRHIMETKPT